MRGVEAGSPFNSPSVIVCLSRRPEAALLRGDSDLSSVAGSPQDRRCRPPGRGETNPDAKQTRAGAEMFYF